MEGKVQYQATLGGAPIAAPAGEQALSQIIREPLDFLALRRRMP